MTEEFKYILIGFGPDVNFAVTRGMNIFIMLMIVLIIVMSSFDTPASISFKDVTVSVTQNPTYNKQIICINN